MMSTESPAFYPASETLQSESLSRSPEPPSLRVSTTFYPGAPIFSSKLMEVDDSDGYYDDSDNSEEASRAADLVLTTEPESIHFYVHSQLLLRHSSNAFAFLITPLPSTPSSSFDPGSAPPSRYPYAPPESAYYPPNSAFAPTAGAKGFGSGDSYNYDYDAGGYANPYLSLHSLPEHVLPTNNEAISTPDRSGNDSVASSSASRSMSNSNSADFRMGGFSSGSGSDDVFSSPIPTDPSPPSSSAAAPYSYPPTSSSSMNPSSTPSTSSGVSGGAGIPLVVIRLHERAEVLNLLLHAVYRLNPARYEPTLEVLSSVPGALLNYGYSLDEHLAPGSELTRLFLNYARAQPLDVYSLAAAYGLEHLAQRASKPTLGMRISAVRQDHATMMGSVYLRRLIHLHVNRLDALKKILLTPPELHSRDNPVACNGRGSSALRAWALATAYLAWEAGPDLSTLKLAQMLAPLLESVDCTVCKHNLQVRVSNVLSSWGHVKDTI